MPELSIPARLFARPTHTTSTMCLSAKNAWTAVQEEPHSLVLDTAAWASEFFPNRWFAHAQTRAAAQKSLSLAEHAREISRTETETLPLVIQVNWLELSKSNLSNTAFERLKMLAQKPVAWRGPGSRPLAASSMQAFLKFWQSIRDTAKEPELMLTPKGTIQAEWHRSYRQFADAEFRGNGRDVNFAIFDRGHTVEATTSIEEAIAVITNYRAGVALTWGQ